MNAGPPISTHAREESVLVKKFQRTSTGSSATPELEHGQSCHAFVDARVVRRSGATEQMKIPVLLIPVLLLALICQAQTLTMQDSVSRMRLSAAEMRQILTAVERSAFDTPDSWEDELSARRVDLGSSPGIVLRGTKLLCGGTGNCQLFVMRKTNRWVSLFGEEQAPLAESFELGPGVTRGIKDLTVVTNSSADVSSRVSYKFDGRVYRRTSR